MIVSFSGSSCNAHLRPGIREQSGGCQDIRQLSPAAPPAIKSIEKDEKESDEQTKENTGQKELIEKPKWMFWK